MPQHPPLSILTVAIVALVAWRLYARLRRNIGRQHFAAARSWTTVVLFPVLVLLVSFGLKAQPATLGLALAGGAAAGVSLGVLGLGLTRFEFTAEGMYYVPSAHLGIALSALLIGRLLYRFFTVGFPGAAPGAAPPAAMHLTPLTLLLIGTLAGYYTTYAAGLLRRSRQAPPTHGTGIPA
ncbi:MAG: hypothetical protein JSR36_02735 [Proteobacteria bacterium]|nr:hypothetical protein [Pseudomonadota bacterium]